jgi:hypothetical protein
MRKNDPLVREIELTLCPGCSIRYDDMSDFARDLDQVQEKIEALVAGGEAMRAVGLYEILLAGCYDKIEECEDSKADLGMFWDDAFCGWVKARQAAGCSPDETVRQIIRWIENDNYGFCFEIEKDVAKVLDKEGLRLFTTHFSSRMDQAMSANGDSKPKAIFEYENNIRLPAIRLKAIYRARNDSPAYAALCARVGLTPKDCEQLAEMEIEKRHWDKAWEWVRQGLEMGSARDWHNECSYQLDYLKIKVLGKLGRTGDALSVAWADFEKYPSDVAYEAFMGFVPKAERGQWHEKAMDVAARGDIGQFMNLCVKAKEWRRLAAKVHESEHGALEAISHYHLEPVAHSMAKRDIPAAAKVCRALAIRILNSKKSKYYDQALSHLRKARDLYIKAQLADEWQAVVDAVRSAHGRKYGFMTEFEDIVSGDKPKIVTFAETVKRRWEKQTS